MEINLLDVEFFWELFFLFDLDFMYIHSFDRLTEVYIQNDNFASFKSGGVEADLNGQIYLGSIAEDPHPLPKEQHDGVLNAHQ